jgi:hypothetical protein
MEGMSRNMGFENWVGGNEFHEETKMIIDAGNQHYDLKDIYRS